MTWVIIFWHKVWDCCPERYGKFQSEIPSTSGAICEKPQGGGALWAPPSGARVKPSARAPRTSPKIISRRQGLARHLLGYLATCHLLRGGGAVLGHFSRSLRWTKHTYLNTEIYYFDFLSSWLLRSPALSVSVSPPLTVHSPGACCQLYYLTDTNPHISSVRYSPGRGKSAARVKHCGTAYPAGARSAGRRGSARPAAQHHNTSLQTWGRPHVLTRASDLLTPPSTWGRPHV